MITLDEFAAKRKTDGVKTEPKPQLEPKRATSSSPTAQTRSDGGKYASDGLVIDELELCRFMRYIDRTHIVFPQGATVVIGKTGAGKTSILDAITFVLYGDSSRTDIKGVKQSDLCKPNGYVCLKFSYGSKSYVVKRGLDNTGKKSYLSLTVDEQKMSGSIPELEVRLKETIGLDYQGFVHSTFVRQEEMKALGSERGSERLKIFQKLFRLEIFGKAQGIVADKLKTLEFELKGVAGEIKAKQDHVMKLPEKQAGLRTKADKYAQENAQLKKLETALAEHEAEAKALAAKHEKFVEIRAKLDAARNTADELAAKLARALRDGERGEQLKSELDKLARETADIETLRTEFEVLQEKSRTMNELREQKRIYERQKAKLAAEQENAVGKLTTRVRAQERRIDGLKTMVDKDEAFGLLRHEGALTERIARIDTEMEWLKDRLELVKGLETEQAQAKAELDTVSGAVAGINVDSFVLSEIKAGIEQLNRDLAENERQYKAKLSEVNTSIEAMTTDISALRFDAATEQRLKVLRSKLADKQRQRQVLERKRVEYDRMGDVSKLVADLKQRKAKLEGDLKSYTSQLETLDVAERRYQTMAEKLKALQKAELGLKERLSALREAIEHTKTEIAEMQRVKSEIAALERKAHELRRKSEIYTVLKDNVFHNKGIVKYAVDILLPRLEIETSKNLADMTDGRFTNVKLESYEENAQYGVRIAVLGVDDVVRDVQQFSGGERTQINAALRFAIARELASLPQVGKTYGRMKTLFIDEGDLGSLDTEISRELFVRKLLALGQIFEKIILITHLTAVAEKFPSQIRITMTPEGQSKVEG